MTFVDSAPVGIPLATAELPPKLTPQKVTHILLVDNDELVRVMLKIDLQRHTDLKIVGVAVNGQEAVNLARSLQPAAIIMDLQMPVMDGLTAAGLIKQEFPQIKIIAYTSLGDPQLEVMSEMAAIDRLCYKDDNADVLAQVIRQWCDAEVL
jgi:two-component system, NarL family, vancomycin resistance associated response regulator VraR